MCKLTLLSTTKTVLSTNLEWGNKIYIKVKKTWALCGRHDHHAALDNRGTYASFKRCVFRKKHCLCNLWSIIRCAVPYNPQPTRVRN